MRIISELIYLVLSIICLPFLPIIKLYISLYNLVTRPKIKMMKYISKTIKIGEIDLIFKTYAIIKRKE